jgi:hypothetical protein
MISNSLACYFNPRLDCRALKFKARQSGNWSAAVWITKRGSLEIEARQSGFRSAAVWNSKRGSLKFEARQSKL